MKPFTHMGIRSKVFLVTFLIILSISFLSHFYIRHFVSKAIHNQLIENGKGLARTIAYYTEEMLGKQQLTGLTDYYKKMVTEEADLQFIYLVDSQNELQAHTVSISTAADIRHLAIPEDELAARHDIDDISNKYVLEIIAPVAGGTLGSVHLGLSDEGTHGKISSIQKSSLLIIILGSFAGGCLALYLTSLILRPLVSLLKATRQVAKGKLDSPLPVPGDDEIGSVTKSFNTMAGELQQRMHSLEKAERALKESETRLRAIFDNAAVGITLSDLEGKLLQSNPAYNRMLGYSGEELKGKSFAELTHPDDVDKHKELYEKLLLGEKDHIHFQKRHLSKEGEIIWGQITLSLLRDEQGIPLLVIGMVENINVRKQLDEERIKSNKLESIGVLAGGIAHDFNNLLTAIIGNIILAQHMIKSEKNIDEILKSAEKASLRAKNLTQQLLTFSRGGAPIKKPLSVKKLLEETVPFLLSGSKVLCKIEIDQALWTVAADEGQLSQVFQNIVKNAEQAMPDGGTILVTAQNMIIDRKSALPAEYGHYVRVSIADQGAGIDSTIIDRIFDPYFTTREKGSGLGLAIAYSIVASHDGVITVESDPGQGTTFFIYLPVESAEEAPVKKDAIISRTEPSVLHGRILIMEDEDAVRSVIISLLDNIGLLVDGAENADKAITLYRKAMEEGTAYDAVILDLTIPGGMGGVETLQVLRKINPEVKAIVSSGYSHDPVMANFRQHGFAAVLSKPYTLRDIAATLSEVLD